MSRRNLDRAAVVQAAARLADRDGLSALTLAVLASELGIKPPSLYNHVESLDALRRELQLEALDLFARQATEAAVGKAGRAAILAIGHTLFDLARERPGLWTALQRAPNPDDTAVQEAGERLLRPLFTVMTGMGIAPDEAVHAVRALRAVVQGFASLEAMGGFGMPQDIRKSFARALERLIPASKRASKG